MPKVSKIEFIDKEETVYDIQVETDESFISEDCVLHNSAICQSLDGQTWPVGSNHPLVPAHINCRSTLTPVVKSFEELGIDLNEIPKGQRPFVRNELTGTVPSTTTYQEWLRQQPAAFQDDVLGKTKGQLFRKGGLSLDRFVDSNSKPVSLRALREMQAKDIQDAFKAIDE